MRRAPALFLSHGSPMFALQPGRLGPQLTALGSTLHGLSGVVVVSPHWQTHGVQVGAATRPDTLYDFGGFAPALNALRYPAPGDPERARGAAALLAAAGFPVALDPRRGLDHGAWVPLRYLLPEAQVPIIPVSMPVDLDVQGALRLGRALAPLRDQGVLVLGSGSLTHNLYEFRQSVRDPEYATEFAHWVHERVQAADTPALLDYRRRAPHAERAHPTEEHLLPLLVALGAAATDAPALHIDGGISEGVLSMDGFAWGLPPAARA